MSDDDITTTGESTRRDYVKFGGAVVGGGLLAGCTGASDDGSTPADNETTGATNGTDESDAAADSDGADESTDATGYSVEMAPVGEVEFDGVPETWESYFPGYADMGVALGKADGLAAVGFKSRYHTSYYDELDGVSVDKGEITQLYDEGIDKELYYELDSDIHLTDPQWLLNNSFFGLDESDVTELTENVAPFIGNTIFRRTDSWHDYRYYTMYEAFEKVAEIFQEGDRFRAFASLHDDLLARVQADLPAADARPAGLLCFAGSDEPEKFSPYRLTDKGTNKKHFHDLGVSDALSGTGVEGLSTDDRGQIDYETILEVDPDALFVRGHEAKSRAEFEDTVLAFMKEHSVASELTAVEDGAVYRGGPIYQGPIQNLFLTERFATLLYPDTYSGELFDRDAVSAIVTGDA
ncbi:MULTISPECIES: ABC transporter substrate-binding protein [Halorubrum]|uniref:Fe3+-hydroxamate ABC transporter substrate-binding protein n=1 Tax=Halorubrum tropicale TaxID=1765655 RepID=A0A0N0BRB3_9EURY|nr:MULTISPECIES: ABC transporter substrate-binding protein [Halorubrum]KOX96574.1 Fe3+-hydroxamate ABC transporter substrate-binding protein [Halorubrum tropicale]TKX44176.1 Fe3+-hydroxamate ABC transporter substrate-binding protein [Halorubrum sp. ARQ200]TKX50916.1 Fe3+-hydroxamate ABC transporter substrate-binding protein [Halorubrum sp. ASP121]